jgi:hypothetical protein
MKELWVLSGFSAWLWIMCRNDMNDDFWDIVVAVLMIIPACVGGPFVWIAAAYVEYEGVIKK